MLVVLAAIEVQSRGHTVRSTHNQFHESGGGDNNASNHADWSNDDYEEEVSPNRYLSHTKRQKQCLQAFGNNAEAISRNHRSDDKKRLEQLKSSAMAISISLVQQHLAGSPFELPILAYTTILLVNSKFNT
jgi:hypothetical protein